MSDIELVIKIPEEKLNIIKNKMYCGIYDPDLYKAIANGTPLEKIRAEIEHHAYPIVHGVNNHEKGMTLYGILQIIDKYKAESEDKEC